MNKTKLIKELEATINRIPKDLLVWEKEIKRLKNKKDPKSKRIRKEYFYHWAFYRGKLFSYIYIMQVLNKGRIRMTPEASTYIKSVFKKSSKLAMNKGMKTMKLKRL